MHRFLSFSLVLAAALCAAGAQGAYQPASAPAPAAKSPQVQPDTSHMGAEELRALIEQLRAGRQEDAARIERLETELKRIKAVVERALTPEPAKPAPQPAAVPPTKSPAKPDEDDEKTAKTTSPYRLAARDIELEGKRWVGGAVLLERWTFRGIYNGALKDLSGAGSNYGFQITGTPAEVKEKWVGFEAVDPSGKRFSYFFAEKATFGERLKAMTGGEAVTISGLVLVFRDGKRYGVRVDKIE
ncbi:MAG: hypothetical protein ACKVS8_14560 [Phycisphaerales bacterium]